MRRTAILFAAFLPAVAQAAPRATIAPAGATTDGRAVEVVTLANDAGMAVRIATLGGTILEVLAPDRAGRLANVVLGQPPVTSWAPRVAGPTNTLIGRYANRIGGRGFTLDGQRYDLPGANKETGVTLHGSPAGFAGKIWRAEPFSRADAAGVVLSIDSPDGEAGFPGALAVRATFTLDASNALRLAWEATTTKPTVVNFTTHTYFALGGPGAGPVYDQRLMVNATRYTPTDAAQVPTGELAPVAGTPFDFRQATRIGDRIRSADPQMLVGRGIDHNFVIDGTGLRRAALLVDPASGRQLEVLTTEPGVQVYTANHFNGSQLGAGGTIRQGDGIAFETQHFPDSPNRPAFPSTVLRPGETFRSITEFRFSVERGARR